MPDTATPVTSHELSSIGERLRLMLPNESEGFKTRVSFYLEQSAKVQGMLMAKEAKSMRPSPKPAEPKQDVAPAEDPNQLRLPIPVVSEKKSTRGGNKKPPTDPAMTVPKAEQAPFTLAGAGSPPKPAAVDEADIDSDDDKFD